MKKYALNYLLGAAILASLTQCKEQAPKSEQPAAPKTVPEKITDFPKVESIGSLKATEMVAAVSNAVLPGDNVIYAPAFLFAWEELHHQLGNPFKLVEPCVALKQVDEATSYKGSLSKGEYDVLVEPADNNGIRITASFKKALPFEEILDTVEQEFLFNGTPVRAFGMPWFNEKIAAKMNILYYESDNRFILSISPKDKTQEIVLAKGFNGAGSLDAILTDIAKARKLGDVQKKMEAKRDRYFFDEEDKVIIPKLRFNLEKTYSDFLHTTIILKKDTVSIVKAKQSTAFILDENGTKVESVAVIEVAPAPAPMMEQDRPVKKPKLLLFNQPFVVMLHKRNVAHPYLMVKVMNTELMVKREQK